MVKLTDGLNFLELCCSSSPPRCLTPSVASRTLSGEGSGGLPTDGSHAATDGKCDTGGEGHLPLTSGVPHH